jgi:hypothetical protein
MLPSTKTRPYEEAGYFEERRASSDSKVDNNFDLIDKINKNMFIT